MRLLFHCTSDPETDQDQPTPTQVVVTRPYGISRANGLVFAGIGIIAVPLSWFQSVDEVNCYRIQDGVLLEFATWAYDDDDENSPTKKPIKLKESLTIPMSSRLRSLAPIKTQIVRGRTRIVANVTESLFRELCIKSENRYRRQQNNALIK